MRVLVACEESQEVCKAFRANGHEAYSADLQDCSGGHPEWHYTGDVLPLLNGNCQFITLGGMLVTIDGKWDLIIAHPPCTDLAVSGARWFREKQEDFRQQKACVFFMQMALANADRIAVENPVGIMSNCYRKPDQVIQPWMFGHPESKSTCLWLKNLPTLKATDNVYEEMMKLPKKERQRILWMGSNHAKERSKTFPGIAKAMADQWGRG